MSSAIIQEHSATLENKKYAAYQIVLNLELANRYTRVYNYNCQGEIGIRPYLVTLVY